MKNTITLVVLVVICMPPICYSEQNITIDELLARYDQTQKNVQTKYIKSETIREDEDSWAKKSDWSICRSEFYTDGTRIDLTIGDWISFSDNDDLILLESSFSTRLIWDESRWYQYDKAEIVEHESVFISTREKWKNDFCSTGYNGAPLEGFFCGDGKTISSIFHEADKIKLYDKKENVNGVPCYVLEDTTEEYGRHKIWLDPEHGYNICQAEVVRTNDDLYYGKPLSTPIPDWVKRIKIPEGKPPVPTSLRVEAVFKMNNVKFQEDTGVWIPVSGDWEEKVTYENGRVITKRLNHKRIEIDLSPDFEAVKAFVPNIPNGTRVRLEGDNPIISLHWVDGKVEHNIDEIVLESTDAMIEELFKESSDENIVSSPRTEQTDSLDKPMDIRDERNILTTRPIVSETYNGRENLLGRVIIFILSSGIVLGLVGLVFFRIKKGG